MFMFACTMHVCMYVNNIAPSAHTQCGCYSNIKCIADILVVAHVPCMSHAHALCMQHAWKTSQIHACYMKHACTLT